MGNALSVWCVGDSVARVGSSESRRTRLLCGRSPSQPGTSQALAQARAPRLGLAKRWRKHVFLPLPNSQGVLERQPPAAGPRRCVRVLVLRPLLGRSPGLAPGGRLSAGPDQRRARPPRPVDRRVLRGEAAAGSHRTNPPGHATRLRGRRGQELLSTRGSGLHGDPTRRPGKCDGGRDQAGRIDHHPANGQEPPAQPRADIPAQDPRDGAGSAHRRLFHQGRDPLPLRQPDLFWSWRLGNRSGGSGLFRQGSPGPHYLRVGPTRRPPPTPQRLLALPQSRLRRTTPSLRAGQDAGRWIYRTWAIRGSRRPPAHHPKPSR